jgi:RTX calcium-binding nonapeptide repeat (4 copies)
MGKGGREMRRTALLLGAMLTALVALSGVAWAVTTIYCSDPQNVKWGRCHGTGGDDYIIGTDKRDAIAANTGDDVVRGRRGVDEINTDYDDSSIDYGNDVIYGGPGDDSLGGSRSSDRYYGGGGDDGMADYYSGDPDVFRCGDGYDRVTYNKGVDKVTADCEELHPYNPYGE